MIDDDIRERLIHDAARIAFRAGYQACREGMSESQGLAKLFAELTKAKHTLPAVVDATRAAARLPEQMLTQCAGTWAHGAFHCECGADNQNECALKGRK